MEYSRLLAMALGKIERCSQLNNFNPNHKIAISTIIWEFLTNYKDQKRRGISLFYEILSDYPTGYKNPHMIKWENDLSQVFTGEQWRKALLTSRKASS